MIYQNFLENTPNCPQVIIIQRTTERESQLRRSSRIWKILKII